MKDKIKTLEARLSAIDQTTLTPLVRNALGSERIEVINWDYKQLHGGLSLGTAIYRFSGQGRDQHLTMPWSLILKILWPEGGSTEISAWNYYKREADAYQSGWLDRPMGGLAAPQCYGVVEYPDGACWL